MIRHEVYKGQEVGRPPVSRAEELMKAHPDITVIRGIVGNIYIHQTLPDKWRHLTVDVAHEDNSQRQYPTVAVSAFATPPETFDVSKFGSEIARHGLQTIVKVHIENDEQVTLEVGYDEREPYPSDYMLRQIRRIEQYAQPIPTQEIITTARTGLDMLRAYQEASSEQRQRINWTLTGFHGWSQIVDGYRPDADTYIALASPALREVMRQEGMSYNHVNTKEFYALNALNKVTNAMLPQKMPPVPPNRREPKSKVIQARLRPVG